MIKVLITEKIIIKDALQVTSVSETYEFDLILEKQNLK